MPVLKAPHVHTCEPALPELHRRLRQVVTYTESSLRVDRMRTKTNGLFEECHADLEWNTC